MKKLYCNKIKTTNINDYNRQIINSDYKTKAVWQICNGMRILPKSNKIIELEINNTPISSPYEVC